MKVLVTAFDPFGGENINPSYEVLKRLKDNIEGAEIIKLQVPTVFYLSVEKVIEKIKEVNPNVVLSIGQAGGRYDISVERIAINIDDARIPDNINQQPIDTPIDPEGNAAYFATIPIKAIVEGIRKENIPASVSNSAGTYVCNHLMYGILNYIHKNNLNIKAGFIHIPYVPAQVVNKPNTPSMSLEDMVKAIEIAIGVIVKNSMDTTDKIENINKSATKKIFAYGTLMSGFENFNKYLKDKAIEIKKGYTYGSLYHLLNYNCPALVDGKDRVWGEIITFCDDGQTLNEIDNMEMYFENGGEPAYLREKREVLYEDGSKELADVYIYQKNIKDKPCIYVGSGDWKSFIKR